MCVYLLPSIETKTNGKKFCSTNPYMYVYLKITFFVSEIESSQFTYNQEYQAYS